MPPGKAPQPSENAPKAAPDSPSSQEVPKRNLPQVTGEAPGESAEEMQDRMLGEFRILRRLGRGGMAEVFLAEQTSLKRNVAIKVLRKERLKDETYIKRFKTEAMAAATLTHPNIIQVITIGEAEGTQFIAQEYVQGMNLREFLVRKGPPEIPLAIHLMKQVCGALAAAHAAGIVHRDIKPENIMITRKGDAKVADFGLAQLTQQGERINLTQVGVTLGTPLYMSPEQVNGSKLDHRSDIYSFGVTCYHMLTGSPPFRRETALSVAVQHLKEVAEPLERLRPDLPPQLCKIVHKMMEKNLERRYQDAQSVLKDLRRAGQDKSDPDGLLTSEPEIALPPPPPRIREAPGYQEKRPGPVLAFLWKLADLSVALQIWLLVVLCLVGGAAAAGAGWLMRTPHPFDKPPQVQTTAPHKDSAAAQFFYAMSQQNDLEAWQAVIDYVPPDKKLQNFAKMQKAMLLLPKGEAYYDEVMSLFNEFAGYGESDPELKAFGLAGQAWIYHQRGNYRQCQQVLESFKPLAAKLENPRMRELAAETYKRNQQQLHQQVDKEWETLFGAPPSAELPPGPQ
jgi:eukaryotic-like serine/threonine-protein kinase